MTRWLLSSLRWGHMLRSTHAVRLIGALGVAALASLAFPMAPALRLSAIALVGWFLYWALQHRLAIRQFEERQHHYRTLLAYLASRLAIGETLERALAGCAQGLSASIKAESRFGRQLFTLGRQLDLLPDSGLALIALEQSQPWPAIKPLLLILPHLQKMGGRLDRFIRDTHAMLVERHNLEQELRAEHSQKTAEALILAMLPFIIAPGFLNQFARDQSLPGWLYWLNQAIRCALYCLAGLAFALNVRGAELAATPKHHQPARRKYPARVWPAIDSLAHHLAQLYHLPVLDDLTKLLWESFLQSARAERTYFQRKVILTLIWAGLAGLWVVGGFLSPGLIILIPVAGAIIQDIQQTRFHLAAINQYRLDYPLLMNWQSQLFQAGFAVPVVMQISQSGWPSGKTLDELRSVPRDLKAFQQAVAGGQSIDRELERLADCAPFPEIRTYWLTVARYEREGSQQVLDLLALQAQSSYQLLRAGRRKELAAQAFYLLFVMLLDLLVILGLSLWPPLSSILF